MDRASTDPSAPTDERIKSARYHPPTYVDGPVAAAPLISSVALASESREPTLASLQGEVSELKVRS